MTADEPSAGARRVVLHIGLLGAGGSYLRSMLDTHREAIEAAGVQLVTADEEAVRDVLASRLEAHDSSGAWQRLVAEVEDAAAPACLISADRLSTATEAVARAVVSAFAPRRVDVIVTAQDMARTVVSAWQHSIANGRRITFQEYADAFTGAADDRPTREQLTRQHDVVTILQRWMAFADSVQLVTVPAPGSADGLLWERFAQAAGIAGDAVPANDVAPYVDGQLAFSEAELLRRVNRRVGNEMARPNYDRYVRDFLAEEVMRPLGERAPDDRAELDAKGRRWATKRGTQISAELAALEVVVVGDLDDLVPTMAGSDRAGGSAPRETYPDTAVRAVAMLVRKLVEIDPAAAPTPEKSDKPRRPREGGRNPQGAGS